MTSVESRAHCRVVVVAPSTRIDLALPADVPIIDLLPMLLSYLGASPDEGGGRHDGWQLARIAGGELDGGRTLRALGVVDGEVLRLAARGERAMAPVFDDVVDVIATARRDQLELQTSNPVLGAAVLMAALLAAALTMLCHDVTGVDAYVAGGLAVALLALATALARGTGETVVAVATGAGGIAFATVCGLEAAPVPDLRWAVLLGASSALCCSVVAALALGSATGTAVFAGAAGVSLLTGLSAALTCFTPVTPVRALAATIAVSLAALSVLPWLAVRLARLPLASASTSSDDLDDLDDLTARARTAGAYLSGMQVGCAVTIGCTATALAGQASAVQPALAATALVAMALRARSVAGRGGRLAMLGSAAASGLGTVAVLVLTHRDGDGTGLLIAELASGALALLLTTAGPRYRLSPPMLRLLDFGESAVILAVVPLAAAALGLY